MYHFNAKCFIQIILLENHAVCDGYYPNQIQRSINKYLNNVAVCHIVLFSL